jgi:xanthine dehydrogenase small subunit
MIEFILNTKKIKTDLPPGMAMLDFIRGEQNLKGTKIGCREGDCGACTVLVGELFDSQLKYRSVTSCLMPLGNAQGKHIVSIEGINGAALNPVQQAIVDEGGTQCGFCTVGFVMSLVGFCLSEKTNNYENALASMDGNICRCTGYKSLERAAALIVEQLNNKSKTELLPWLVQNNYIPSYFEKIQEQLEHINAPANMASQGILVGGGTDLYVQKHDSMIEATIQFVANNAQYTGISKVGNIFTIGASTTVEELKNNALMLVNFPRLDQHLKLVSSTPIRNMATLAGNFVNASPIGDMTIFFLALNARLQLSTKNNQRTIYLKDFYKAYKTLDLLPEEIIVSLDFEMPSNNFYFNFEKVSKRKYLDIASANSALQIGLTNTKITSAHLACGGVFAYPKYMEKTSNFLIGSEISKATILAAEEILQQEIAPISDARGSIEYKRMLSRHLFFAHFTELFPEQIVLDDLLQASAI